VTLLSNARPKTKERTNEAAPGRSARYSGFGKTALFYD